MPLTHYECHTRIVCIRRHQMTILLMLAMLFQYPVVNQPRTKTPAPVRPVVCTTVCY